MHIGADTHLFTEADKARCRITAGKLDALLPPFEKLRAHPWLDVGAGESFMRDLLAEKFGFQPEYCENDLDIDPYRYADNRFHLITSFEILEHLYNPLFHLMEVRRVLAPDGIFLLTTPNDHGLIYKAEHLLGRKYEVHFHQFAELDLRKIFARAGLDIVHLEKFFGRKSGTIARVSRNQFLISARKGKIPGSTA